MIANPITLAEAGRMSAALGSVSPATVRIIPTVAAPASAPAPASTSIPEPRPSSATAYFGLFRSCDCGHSSAWHKGAFGDAWRAGQQVRGRCEASAEGGAAAACGCPQFHEPELAG